jgi:hypothetical protein
MAGRSEENDGRGTIFPKVKCARGEVGDAKREVGDANAQVGAAIGELGDAIGHVRDAIARVGGWIGDVSGAGRDPATAIVERGDGDPGLG